MTTTKIAITLPEEALAKVHRRCPLVLVRLAATVAVCGTLILVFASAARADVIQTTGAGSALMDVNASAFFESTNALFDNPYIEGGMLFSRTRLRNNNNGCGFAGCVFPYFSGNYMYGANEVGGFFTISTMAGNVFTGLEFIAGTGFNAPVNFIWTAFLDGIQKGSGAGSVPQGTILGFADRTGFDTLNWTASDSVLPSFTSTHNAPAFDNVEAQISSVPESSSLTLLVIGLLSICSAQRGCPVCR